MITFHCSFTFWQVFVTGLGVIMRVVIMRGWPDQMNLWILQTGISHNQMQSTQISALLRVFFSISDGDHGTAVILKHLFVNSTEKIYMYVRIVLGSGEGSQFYRKLESKIVQIISNRIHFSFFLFLSCHCPPKFRIE